MDHFFCPLLLQYPLQTHPNVGYGQKHIHFFAPLIRECSSTIKTCLFLTNEEATEHLMRYVNSTGGFKQTYGEISIN